MEQHNRGFGSIDEYIATFPEDIQALLEEVRTIIKANAPGASERISYQMPAFVLNGNLVYFAAWKNHIGFYPGSGKVSEAFEEELATYIGSKGSIRFPISQPLPVELIGKIVQFRVAENLKMAAAKASKKKA